MNKWRPEDWKEIKSTIRKNMPLTPIVNGVVDPFDPCIEAGADAMLEALKKKGLYGEYGEDFIISSKVKPDNRDWAETFFKTLDGGGYLVFIPEGDDDE